MDNLSDVISTCRGLLLDKVTERKRSAEKFRQLLCKSSVLKALDKYTDGKNRGSSDDQLTWDYVFKTVAKYVVIETQHLQKSKEQSSAASLTRKEKAKKEVSDLVKFVIRQADKRGPRLKCSSLLNHLDEVMQDEFMCKSYGIDYSNILLKNILSVRKYWVEITSSTWHNLIALYVRIYACQEYGIDKTLLSRVISTLISGATTQCDVKPKRLLNFFTEVFKNVRQERTLVVIENLLSALNVFMTNIATNSRTQICKLGEAVFINMLFIWENRPTPLLKVELIEFLRLQMHAHHPGGCKRDTAGAYAMDWDTWMSHLRKLYEVLYEDFQQIGGRKRFSGGCRNATMSAKYIDLAAQVCNQLFQSSEHVLEVTQTCETQDRPGAKKRRLESGWTSVRDIIISLGQTVQLTPWLQLITRVMEKFPESLAEDEVVPYLSCFSSLITEIKKAEVTQYLLLCVESFASSWKKIRGSQNTTDLCRPIWRKIWTSTLRYVSLHHAAPQGFKLLTTMLEQMIITPDKDVWSLFLPNISFPTQESVDFLLCILQGSNIPENFQPSVLTSADYCDTKYPLRSQLIDWLLPSSERFSSTSLANNSEINQESVARALVLLMIKNQSSFCTFQGVEKVSIVTDLEKIYLQSSHQFPVANKFLENKSLKNQQMDSITLPIFLSKVEKMLEEEAILLLDVTDIQPYHCERAALYVCLISKLIHWALKYKVIDGNSVMKMDMVSQFKTIYKRLGHFMGETVQKDGPSAVTKVLFILQTMFETMDYWNESDVMAARIIRCLCPTKIIDLLLGMISNKITKQSLSTTHTLSDIGHIKLSNRYRPNQSRQIIEDDDMDLEFDQPLARDQGEEEEDDEFGDSQESEDSNKNSFQCPLCPSSMTDIQKVRLTALNILCLWCGYDKIEMAKILPLDSLADPKQIKNKIEDLIEEEELDSSRSFDLQMFNTIVTGLMTNYHKVTDTDVENIINAIRRVTKQQRKDQSVSCICLDLLSAVVHYLGDDELPSKTIADCRDIAVHLLSAFWKLQDQFSSKVRLATAKCMMAFIEADPKNEWALLTTGEENSENIGSEFIQTISDLSLDVRMYASQVVSRLYVSGDKTPVPVHRSLQIQLFEKIYVIINETMEVTSKQGKLSVERAQDEKNNRTASALTIVGNIMSTSVVCENKAIVALCQLVREYEIDIRQVQNVLERVSSLLGYVSAYYYMSHHIPYILNQWLGLSYPIGEFPYQLAFCSNRVEFYRDFYPTIIPLLIIKRNILWGKELVTEIRESWEEILRQCIPQIVVHMFPLFALAESGTVSIDEGLKNRVSNANSCYDLLTKETTKEVVEKTLVSRLDDVVVNILMCLYDTDDEFVKTGSIKNIDPEPNPTSYNTYIVRSTLDYITDSFSGGSKTLVEVLSKNQDSIQKILLELAKRLNKQHRLHEKRRIFLMYKLFIKLLLREFVHQLGGSWAYVLRETIHRLINITKDVLKISRSGVSDYGYSENIMCMALQLLRDICTVGLEVCPEELSKYLSFIVGNLNPMVVLPSADITQEASLLLQLLIVDNHATLRQSITSLDPFPDDEQYQQFSKIYRRLKYADGPFSLTQDICHFLSSSSIQKEGLHHLSQQLHLNKQQLVTITSHDSEGNDIISQLICKLLQMYQDTSDDVTIEICKCLGEIGAVDLERTTVTGVDHIVETIASEFSGSQQNYCQIFHMLNQYLVEENMSVVEAASDVLKTLLSTKTGYTFATHYRDKMGDKEFLFQYLHPFRPRKKLQEVKPESLSVEEFQQIVDVETLWTPDNSRHDDWINNITCILINAGVQDEILSQLQPICMIKTKFSEMILPLLIHDLLLQDQPIHREVLSSHFRRFFSSHIEDDCISRSNSAMSITSKNSNNITRDKDSIRTMLNVVQYLRQQDKPREGRRVMTAWDNNFWLDLDFLHLSKAALYCSAHFSAILFAEIWCDIQRQAQDYTGDSQKGTGFSQGFSQATVIDSLGLNSSANINVQDLLLEAYQQIGDPDGLYGCGAGRLAKTSSRVKSYEHENKWEKAVITYDIEMCQTSSSSSTQYDLLQALHNLGSRHVLERYLQTMTGSTDHVRDLQFQSAWKTGQWNLEANNRVENTVGFNEAVYKALVAMKDGHSQMVVRAANTARLLTINRLSAGRMESARCLYPVLADLQCISQIDDILQYNILKKEGYDELTTRWRSDDSLMDTEFIYVEPTLNIRCSILRMLQLTHNDPSLSVCYQHQLLKLAELARECGRHQIAERAVFNLKETESNDIKLQIPKLIEEAKLYWARSEENTAKHLMKNLITKLDKLQDDSIDAAMFYPRVLSIYGNWLAETRSENPNVIMEDYLEKTVGLLETLHEQGDIALDAYLSLARYADSQYQNVVNYMKSNTYEAKQNLMRDAQAEVESLREIVDPNKDRYYKIVSKQCNIDKAEIEAMNKDKTRFLQKAVENYLKCLKYGDKHDLRIFRMVSLWFSNGSVETINSLIEKSALMLKSYKFLPLMYQLAARMDTQTDHGQNFQAILNKIIERSALDHPHHTLLCVLALAHAKKDSDILNTASKSNRRSKLSKSDPNKDEGRVEAAKLMIARLKNKTPVATIVENLEKLCTAYIQLANYNVDLYKKETRPIQLQNSLLITKIKDFHNVAIPTVEVKVDPTCKYKDIISLKGFQPTFKLAGGINLPKIIGCIGSDGKVRRQLVKGRDDLRQDAVMQQVFGMVNNLLQKTSETRKRKLHVRQYKVVPLSQMSGLLEWCEGTMPIGEYLVANIMGDESPGAHCRYRPDDYTALESRRHMAGVHQSTDPIKKYKVFLAICKKFQPVFRHFFMEKFRDPAFWFEARLAYTKSVATNSIVGYILGLGDRHVQNILVDCNTAELVHIDLGVAFEQGKILPTPETVPFRLTRDIVDGMGVSGVEGVFRRCCEKTMEVMHHNQEALMTILEVLLYDPLYAWSMSPAKAFALQQRRDRDPDASELNTTKDVLDFAETSEPAVNRENVNKLAERVLLRLRQKLQGIEDGVQLSVSGQVNLLIQEARDPKNLSRLFPGWQPYI